MEVLIAAKDVCACVHSCPTLCDLMDCSPPGSSVHGISQARILEVGCHFLLQFQRILGFILRIKEEGCWPDVICRNKTKYCSQKLDLILNIYLALIKLPLHSSYHESNPMTTHRYLYCLTFQIRRRRLSNYITVHTSHCLKEVDSSQVLLSKHV